MSEQVIKFRVRHKESDAIVGKEWLRKDGRWRYSDFQRINSSVFNTPIFAAPQFLREQFIGITDKNGREVYAGDSLQGGGPDPDSFWAGVVMWDSDSMRWALGENSLIAEPPLWMDPLCDYTNGDFEVIPEVEK